MNTKSLRFLLCITLTLIVTLGSLLLLLRPPAAYAATRTVTKVADTNGTCTVITCSLREAIAAAAPGDTIVFASSLAGQTIKLSSPLVVAKNLTIDGSSLSTHVNISGNNAVLILNIITSSVVTLNHLNIISGNNADFESEGGGIYNQGTLTVQNSTISGNSGGMVGRGGGIYNASGALTVQNATFANNSGLFGGGIYNMSGAVMVQNTTFADNSGTYGGGGIYNDQGTLTINNSTLSGNTTIGMFFSQPGGGIYNYTGTLTLSNSTLSGNSASYGGGIYNRGKLTAQNSTLSGNSATDDGGGICNDKNTALLALTHVTLNRNTADTDSKGGDKGGGVFVNNGATLLMTNTIIAGNSAGINPAYDDCFNSSATISSKGHNLVGNNTGCPVEANDQTTTDPLLGLLANNGGGTWTQALLPGSPAIDAVPVCAVSTDQRGYSRPYPGGGACDIGAYEVGSLRLTKTATPDANVPYHSLVTYTIVLSNTGGADTVRLTDTLPAKVSFNSWVISPTNTTLAGNEIRWHGALAAGQAVTFTFQVNQTGDYGERVTNLARFSGAADSGSGQGSFDVECFPTYTVKNANDSGAESLRQGIASVCSGGRITFNGNTSIYLDSELTIAKRLTIDGENHAITISGDSGHNGSPDVLVFKIVAGSVVTLSHLNIINGYGFFGGGISNESMVTVQNSTVSGNSAEHGGGGIYSRGTLVAQNCTISGNSSSQGGGIDNQGVAMVQNSTISDNSAINAGGGIDSSGSMLTVQNSTISGNSATYGGGIRNLDYGTLTIQNSTLSGNSVDSITGDDCIGGGIYVISSNANINNSTIVNNTAASPNQANSGIVASGSYAGKMTLSNSIVANNNGTNNFKVEESATFASQGYNLANSWNGLSIQPTDQTTNPLLGSLADNGGATWTHALLPGSPAINAVPVISCTVATDQRGIPRPAPAGGQCDIGAYEVGPLRLTKTATPSSGVPYHGVVTYTLVLSNTGGAPDSSVWLTDTLPAKVAFNRWVISPTNTTLASNEIRWNGALAASEAVTFTFQVSHTGNYGDHVTNLARFSGALDSGSGQGSFYVEGRVYLPFILRN